MTIAAVAVVIFGVGALIVALRNIARDAKRHDEWRKRHGR